MINNNFSSLMIDSRVLQNGPDFVPKIIKAIQGLEPLRSAENYADKKKKNNQVINQMSVRSSGLLTHRSAHIADLNIPDSKNELDASVSR